jgi:hypothetical protein
MFDGNSDVFANIPTEHRPDHGGAPSLPPRQAVADAMPGMGANPDGIGAYQTAGGGVPVTPEQAAAMGPIGQMGAMMPFEPHDVSPEAAVRSAGITTLVAALSFGGGLAIGGWKGGVAGLLLSGGAFNAYRAQKWWGSPDPSEKHESVVSAIFGLVGVAAGGYVAYKAYEGRAE